MGYTRTASLIGAATLAFALLGWTQVQAANPAYCAKYANLAVAQQNKNVVLGCGLTGPRWMNNYGLHYSWCLGAPLAAAKAETHARIAGLQQCAAASPVKTFANPKFNGLRLDWCYTDGTGCGAPAAKAFCVANGYPLVKSWGAAENIGTFTDTRIIGNNHICHGDYCDGFSYIKCSKQP
jgi:hypothetical protein